MLFYCKSLGIDEEDFVSAPFDENLYEEIKVATNRILQMSNEMDYFCVIEYNLKSLIQNLYKKSFYDGQDFIVLNSNFANMLNAFYTWKCYHKHISGDKFDRLLEQYRMHHLEFCLADELRNYTTHNSLAIKSVSYDSINEVMAYEINPNDLLNSGDQRRKMNSNLRKWLLELSNNKKTIDAYTFALNFYQLCKALQNELWGSYIWRVHTDLEMLCSVMPQDFFNVYNIDLVSDDESVHWCFGQIIAKFLAKAQCYYPGFVPSCFLGKY